MTYRTPPRPAPEPALPSRGAPRSLFDATRPPGAARRILSHDECASLLERILRLTKGGGDTALGIESRWVGNLRWALNRATTSGDTTNHTVRILRSINGARGVAETNKLDDASLRLAIESAERVATFYPENPDALPLPGAQRYLEPQLWSEATASLDAQARSRGAQTLVEPAREAGLLSAGYIEVSTQARAVLNTNGMNAYYAATRGEYSVTVRNEAGTGSGWAGTDDYDWERIDVDALSARALKKCVDSADARAIEPGRYTVILEPQAVHDLMVMAIYLMDRVQAERSRSVYTLRPGYSKIGQKIFDHRITISTDPMDPECGYIPFDRDGYPYRAVTWVQDGVLKELSYNRHYALTQLGHGIPLPNPFAYRVSGGPTSVEEMIATTQRGLLVTRLNGVTIVDMESLLLSGTTRDGMWLIERGKITRPVKNMRFTDSPMFAFNNVAQVGPVARVYAPYPAIVPYIKVRDFNFMALADAV